MYKKEAKLNGIFWNGCLIGKIIFKHKEMITTEVKE